MAEMLAGWLSALDGAPMRLGFGGSSGDTVPFDAMLVFATNLAPASVFDPAFLRRIGYRIGLGPLAEPAYRAVLRRACRLRGIDCDEVVLDHRSCVCIAPAARRCWPAIRTSCLAVCSISPASPEPNRA
ncbi:hypothetical protein [Massilia sp. Se16.2.3]|uniref:hypothetical protein n=1 Tax=Massilia sp. Se16.2.3 TaxID=2709303 RepID=UPI0016030288|nr:hypothetical protein [Massilia sp. Se16.2.3]QNA98032.1 hypothetical protein G4G31_03020 [Massilia sp. Se16.2.3]